MTYPADFTPAYEALYAALTTCTSKPRALRTEALFARLLGPKDDAAQAYGQTLSKKRCFVKIGAPSSVTEHVNCDFARYFCTVEVLRLYRPGKDLFAAETDAAMRQAMRDAHLVAQALTYPTALSATPDESETGIDGGCLDLSGHTTTGPDHDAANSVVRMVDRFNVSITLASVDL